MSMDQNNLLDIAAFSPDFLQSPSAWLGHLPFAAWVIREASSKVFVELGTHYGHSYFSFCQSVIEADLSTKCYAVDTWQGDEHAGQYGDEIFAKVNVHHQERYAGFSRLLRTTFDDAATYFADESIDLLHIDGLHTYEAVRHDFETWLPKLAPGAVVMFHDTNVRERNFGVWKLWGELQASYPNNLEFVHSHGLGVLQLNNAPHDKRLEWLQPDWPEKQRLKNYFAALGSRQLERFELNELKQHAASLNQVVAERDSQIVGLNQAAVERDGQVASLNQVIAERDSQIVGLNQAAVERDMARFALNAVLTSSSWRLTRPFRWIGNQIKRALVLLRWLLVGPFRLLTFIKDRFLGVMERFHKLFCFWRNYGTRSLVRRIFFKLKAQNTHHPVPKERSEVLAKRGARELAEFRFDACSPLRVYSTPSEKPSRISIVTDSINSGSLFGGVGTAIIMAALLAEAKGARLRVVTRTESAQQGNLGHVLTTNGIQLTHEVEFVFAPFYDRRYEINIFDDELFITTSWWTTAATMASVPHDSIIYLLQEDERMFYPYGDDHLRCTQVLSSQKIHFVLNTKLLFDHLVADGLGNIAERGFWFEPAFPRDVFHPRALKASGKRTLMFYARPNNLRNLFYFGIELIEEAITRGTIDLTKWGILLVGKDIPNVVFGDGHVPEKRENLTWAEYAELAGKVDLGLCLMNTPHPSYPPLDLAASGAVVVTNRFGNKRDLGNYSKNIVCGDLNQESMINALAEGLRLAANTAERFENHRSSALGSDWRLSFSEVIQHFAKVRYAVN